MQFKGNEKDLFSATCKEAKSAVLQCVVSILRVDHINSVHTPPNWRECERSMVHLTSLSCHLNQMQFTHSPTP